MEHARPGDLVPMVTEDGVSGRAVLSLGAFLILGLLFWGALFLLMIG